MSVDKFLSIQSTPPDQGLLHILFHRVQVVVAFLDDLLCI